MRLYKRQRHDAMRTQFIYKFLIQSHSKCQFSLALYEYTASHTQTHTHKVLGSISKKFFFSSRDDGVFRPKSKQSVKTVNKHRVTLSV